MSWHWPGPILVSTWKVKFWPVGIVQSPQAPRTLNAWRLFQVLPPLPPEKSTTLPGHWARDLFPEKEPESGTDWHLSAGCLALTQLWDLCSACAPGSTPMMPFSALSLLGLRSRPEALFSLDSLFPLGGRPSPEPPAQRRRLQASSPNCA